MLLMQSPSAMQVIFALNSGTVTVQNLQARLDITEGIKHLFRRESVDVIYLTVMFACLFVSLIGH